MAVLTFPSIIPDTIDFGIRYKNYCTDTTRTIHIGKPSKKEIELYNLLLNTQKDIIKKEHGIYERNLQKS